MDERDKDPVLRMDSAYEPFAVKNWGCEGGVVGSSHFLRSVLHDHQPPRRGTAREQPRPPAPAPTAAASFTKRFAELRNGSRRSNGSGFSNPFPPGTKPLAADQSEEEEVLSLGKVDDACRHPVHQENLRHLFVCFSPTMSNYIIIVSKTAFIEVPYM